MTTRKLQNATRFQIQPRGQCFTMNCTEAMKAQREQSTHRATRSQNDVPNDMMINVSMPRKVHVTQGQTHTWTKLPWNTRNGLSLSLNHKPRLTAQVPTTHERKHRIPGKCESNDKNEIQSTQTTTCRANDTSLTAFAHAVLNCIQDLIKSCSPIRISACF